MPIIDQIEVNDQCKLVIYETSESLEKLLSLVTLSAHERSKIDSFKSINRKIEYTATRYLVQECIGKDVRIENDEHGKPQLINSDLNISISHTKSFVGILFGSEHSVALDMEYLSDRVNRIASRFLSEKELEGISSINKELHLYQHWCAKECLIKMYGKKDVHLIEELKIHPFQITDNHFSGEVCRNDFAESFTFYHKQFGSHLLVYSTKKIR